jgi:hypothetical protein
MKNYNRAKFCCRFRAEVNLPTWVFEQFSWVLQTETRITKLFAGRFTDCAVKTFAGQIPKRVGTDVFAKQNY